jgi:PadR family transcriptional regulator PadR
MRGRAGAETIAIPVERLDEDFFVLRTRVAGEFVQKFVTYGVRLAILGDISKYKNDSKAFHDFVYEANRGRDLWFVASREGDRATPIDRHRHLIYYIEQMPAIYLGEFEQIVLLAVLRLGEKAYGVPIRAEIENRAGRKVTVGALYATLDRLEAKGLVHSWFADATAKRGGRSKRYFKFLPAGVDALSGSKSCIRTHVGGSACLSRRS